MDEVSFYSFVPNAGRLVSDQTIAGDGGCSRWCQPEQALIPPKLEFEVVAGLPVQSRRGTAEIADVAQR
jgi:hypothetical protein